MSSLFLHSKIPLRAGSQQGAEHVAPTTASQPETTAATTAVTIPTTATGNDGDGDGDGDDEDDGSGKGMIIATTNDDSDNDDGAATTSTTATMGCGSKGSKGKVVQRETMIATTTNSDGDRRW